MDIVIRTVQESLREMAALVLATKEGNEAGHTALVLLPLGVVLELFVASLFQDGNAAEVADQGVLENGADGSKANGPRWEVRGSV